VVDEGKDLGRCDCSTSLREPGWLQPRIVGADLEAVGRIGLHVLELERVPEQCRERRESAVDCRLGELPAKQLILNFE
jgi:hypothetical protein